jgi:hypothetical protein
MCLSLFLLPNFRSRAHIKKKCGRKITDFRAVKDTEENTAASFTQHPVVFVLSCTARDEM